MTTGRRLRLIAGEAHRLAFTWYQPLPDGGRDPVDLTGKAVVFTVYDDDETYLELDRDDGLAVDDNDGYILAAIPADTDIPDGCRYRLRVDGQTIVQGGVLVDD